MRTSSPRRLAAVLLAILLACPAWAGDLARTASGQKVYVPAYSHIYQGVKGRPFNLAVMLSIRNVDDAKPITVTMIKYYDDHGDLVKDHLEKPLTIGPMGTREIYLPDRNSTGGSGANFIVRWASPEPVSVPVIQAVMIGTASTQGISFVCDGVVLEED